MLIIKRTLLRNSFSLLFILIVINPKSNGCVNKGISKIYPAHNLLISSVTYIPKWNKIGRRIKHRIFAGDSRSSLCFFTINYSIIYAAYHMHYNNMICTKNDPFLNNDGESTIEILKFSFCYFMTVSLMTH